MIITSSPHILPVMFSIALVARRNLPALSRWRRRVWQGGAPSEPEAT